MTDHNGNLPDKSLNTAGDSSKDLNATVEEYRPRLLRFVRGWVKSNEDAEDLVQDVLYRFVKTLGENVMQIELLSAWMFRVARNAVISFGRKKHEKVLTDCTDDEWTDFSELLFANDIPDPETAYLRSLVWEELADALAELPKAQSKVFEMTEFDGLSIKEISQRTGIPAATLLSRKHYAVKHLRKRLEEIYRTLLEC